MMEFEMKQILLAAVFLLAGCGEEEQETNCSGDFHIQSQMDLDKVANCERISGNLVIYDNEALTNIDGLSNLRNVEGYLYIEGNSALTNLDGLSGLRYVHWNAEIKDNAVLTNLDGLSRLTTVGGDLHVYDNPSLCQSFVDAFLALFPDNITSFGDNDDSC